MIAGSFLNYFLGDGFGFLSRWVVLGCFKA